MFCQAFDSSIVFWPNGNDDVEVTRMYGEVSYNLCHDIFGDGNVCLSISYYCEGHNGLIVPNDDQPITAYKSPNIDIDVDVNTDSNGYLSQWCLQEDA